MISRRKGESSNTGSERGGGGGAGAPLPLPVKRPRLLSAAVSYDIRNEDISIKTIVLLIDWHHQPIDCVS